jgi:hypothetical protein
VVLEWRVRNEEERRSFFHLVDKFRKKIKKSIIVIVVGG